MSSCTKDCQHEIAPLFGKKGAEIVKVIDTPGFMDSVGSDDGTIAAIMTILGEIQDKGFCIGLFCFAATETRCDRSVKEAL